MTLHWEKENQPPCFWYICRYIHKYMCVWWAGGRACTHTCICACVRARVASLIGQPGFRNEDIHLWTKTCICGHKIVAQRSQIAFSSFSTLFVKPNRQIIVWMQLVILWMGVAEGTFGFDLELKKRSSLVTISDKISYTFNWIPILTYTSVV